MIFIPNRIKVGFCKRDDTYSGKLAYIIYYDEKGTLRKEQSLEGWRNQNKPDGKIVMRGDSTISESCAQGDGWATVDVEQNNKVIELKCSTVSGTMGCIEKADFQSRKQYSNQEGVCNKELPFPLPKILK